MTRHFDCAFATVGVDASEREDPGYNPSLCQNLDRALAPLKGICAADRSDSDLTVLLDLGYHQRNLIEMRRNEHMRPVGAAEHLYEKVALWIYLRLITQASAPGP